jgi:hypothetical protein
MCVREATVLQVTSGPLPFQVPKRQRETDIHHHGQTDNLGADVIVLEGVCFRHE